MDRQQVGGVSRANPGQVLIREGHVVCTDISLIPHLYLQVALTHRPHLLAAGHVPADDDSTGVRRGQAQPPVPELSGPRQLITGGQ